MGAEKVRALRNILWGCGNLCGICEKPIAEKRLATLDHIVPKFYGGRTLLSNARLAHKRCNNSRNHTMPFYSSTLATPYKLAPNPHQEGSK